MDFEKFFNDSLNKYIPFHKKLSDYELELIDIMFAAGAAEALNYVRKDNDKFLEMAESISKYSMSKITNVVKTEIVKLKENDNTLCPECKLDAIVITKIGTYCTKCNYKYGLSDN